MCAQGGVSTAAKRSVLCSVAVCSLAASGLCMHICPPLGRAHPVAAGHCRGLYVLQCTGRMSAITRVLGATPHSGSSSACVRPQLHLGLSRRRCTVCLGGASLLVWTGAEHSMSGEAAGDGRVMCVLERRALIDLFAQPHRGQVGQHCWQGLVWLGRVSTLFFGGLCWCCVRHPVLRSHQL